MNETKFIEMPLEMYCRLRDISIRTVYNQRQKGEITLKKIGSKNYILVPENSIYILGGEEESTNTLLKRRSKKLKENLTRIAKELDEAIFLLDAHSKLN